MADLQMGAHPTEALPMAVHLMVVLLMEVQITVVLPVAVLAPLPVLLLMAALLMEAVLWDLGVSLAFQATGLSLRLQEYHQPIVVASAKATPAA